jgi:hypothetical protein
MTSRLRAALVLVAASAPWALAGAQEPPPQTPVSPAGAIADRSWSGNLQTYLYLQEDDDFLMPILGVDRGALHFEGRFQYEDRQTGSLWAGWTLEAGEGLHLEAVPMAGVVFGRTSGLAPGLELTLTWKSIELYTESEYVFDLQSREDSYFYVWSELSWQALTWLRLGLSAQRTRMYRSELDLERGIFAAVSRGAVELGVYGYNLDGDSPFAIVAVGVDF